MLTPLADGVWSADTTFQAPGLSGPLRMTVLSLPGDGLVLHSPVPLDDALEAELRALGEVRALVSPNLYHHLHLTQAAARFPEAQVLTPPGLAAKRPDLGAHTVMEPGMADPFGGAIAWQRVEGAPGMNEAVLLHRPSGTLVTSDLVFNVQRADGLFSPLFFMSTGTWKKVAFSRAWRYWFIQDRAAAGASARAILAWDFDRVTMGHGDVIPRDGKAVLTEVLEWLLAG